MESKMVEIKIAVSAIFTAISAILGWQGIMALVWVAVMIIDYITGTAAASKNGEWCSATARQGVWHKVGMIVVATVSLIADWTMAVICQHLPIGVKWTTIVFPMVLAWYIVTELGSILENAVKMGAPVPSWLTKMLKISLTAINTAGEKTEAETSAVDAATYTDHKD